MRGFYAKKTSESKPNLELSQREIEKLNFDEMCKFVQRVLNCQHLSVTDSYWAEVCGVGDRWVRAWKGGKRVHIKHIQKIVEELPKLIEKANARVDYIRVWSDRMRLLILKKSLNQDGGRNN